MSRLAKHFTSEFTTKNNSAKPEVKPNTEGFTENNNMRGVKQKKNPNLSTVSSTSLKTSLLS